MSHRRKKIALLVPSSNTIMENDLHGALPKNLFTVHAARMYLVETTAEAEKMMLDKYAESAASDLGTTKPDLIVFGCTSAGSLFGLKRDAEFCANLGRIANCPSLSVINAVNRALTTAKARKVAVIAPYNEELTASVATALSSEGREVVAAYGMGITVNVELADPEPADIVAFAREKLKGVSFDTLFVSCTNFRSLEAKPELESVLGARVITSNGAVVDAINTIFGSQDAAVLTGAAS